jgi:hypothetical protein
MAKQVRIGVIDGQGGLALDKKGSCGDKAGTPPHLVDKAVTGLLKEVLHNV